MGVIVWGQSFPRKSILADRLISQFILVYSLKRKEKVEGNLLIFGFPLVPEYPEYIRHIFWHFLYVAIFFWSSTNLNDIYLTCPIFSILYLTQNQQEAAWDFGTYLYFRSGELNGYVTFPLWDCVFLFKIRMYWQLSCIQQNRRKEEKMKLVYFCLV